MSARETRLRDRFSKLFKPSKGTKLGHPSDSAQQPSSPQSEPVGSPTHQPLSESGEHPAETSVKDIDQTSTVKLQNNALAEPTEIAKGEAISEGLSPNDLWGLAFSMLDAKSQAILNETQQDLVAPARNPVTAVEAVKQQTEAAYTESLHKGPVLKIGDNVEINLRVQAKRILSSTMAFKSCVDGAVSCDPSSHAAAAWTIVSFALTLLQNDMDRQDDVMEASAFLASIISRYKSIETHFLGRSFDDTDQLKTAIVDVYLATLQYSAAVWEAHQSSRLVRTLATFEALSGQPLRALKSVVKEKDASVEIWRQIVGHQYRLSEFEESDQKAEAILKKVDLVASDLAAVKKAILSAEEKGLLDWTSSIDVSNFYNRSLTLREPGTGEWFIASEEFRIWKESPSSFLWLYGTSGCGKTVLCSTIIEDLSQWCLRTNSALVYWNFDFNDIERQTVASFLKSVIRQLAAAAKTLPQALYDLASEFRAAGKQPPVQRIRSALNEIIAGLGREVFMVIDALDECPERAEHVQRRDMLDELKQLHSRDYRNLHILATSRNEIDIQRSLQTVAPQKLRIEDLFHNDISLLVRKRLEGGNLSRWSQRVKHEIENALLRVDEPRFRWAALQLEALDECHDEAELKESLTELPESLEEIYERTFVRLSKRNRSKVRSILQWVTYSTRPLSLEEVAEVAGLPFPDDVLSICTGTLITTSKEQLHLYMDAPHALYVGDLIIRVCDVVRLAHFSVREYLCSERCKQLEMLTGISFVLNPSISHAAIAKTCVSRLLQQLGDPNALIQNEIESIRFEGPQELIVSPKAHPWMRTDQPLIQYIAASWSHHVLEGNLGENVDQTLADLVTKFFSPPLSAYYYWLRFYDPEGCRFRILTRNDQCAPPTYIAALLGLVTLIPSLRKSEVQQYNRSTRYKYALSAAAANGHQNAVKHLLEAGADIDPDPTETTTLIIASCHGHTEIVKQLLDAGAKINLEDSENETALCVACTGGHSGVIKALLQAGATIHFSRPEGDPPSALQAACITGKEEAVMLLLEAGADVNKAEAKYHTALQAACLFSQSGVIDKLLTSGADVNAQGGFHGSPLKATLEQARPDTIRQILKAGADVNAMNEDEQGGFTALHKAVDSTFRFSEITQSRSRIETVRILLDAGADVNAKSKDELGRGGTALHKAIAQSSIEVVRLLLEAGADVHLLGTGSYGPEGTALHQAVASDAISDEAKKELVRMLLEAGADVQAKNERGQTVLQVASIQKYIGEKVQSLLLQLESFSRLS